MTPAAPAGAGSVTAGPPDGWAVPGGPAAATRGAGGVRRRLSPLRLLVATVLVAAAATAWLLTRPAAPAYRTTDVEQGDAVATLDAVGTVTPVHQADLTFATAGTVGSVDVAVGQQVTAGQTLASLDATPLDDAVVSAQASLAQAQATLATDEAAQSATTVAAPVPSGSASPPPADPSASAATGAKAPRWPPCRRCWSPPSSTRTPTPRPPSPPWPRPPPPAPAPAAPGGPPGAASTGGSGGSAPGAAPTCAEELSRATAAQQAVVADITAVQKAEATLTGALEGSGPTAAGAGSGGVGGTAPATTTPSTLSATPPRTASPTATSAASGRTRTVTAQQVALDQADVDVAQARLDQAQQAAAGSELVSTLAGTVASVTVGPGQSVAAGSPGSGPEVVVIGSGSTYQVTADVPVAEIGRVAVGQQVLVTPDTSTATVRGTVTAIGVLATSTSSSVTYPVTVALDAAGLGSFSGAEATLSIVTGETDGVPTVPTSAVRTVGADHFVTVLEGTTPRAVRVGVGTVGAVRTQITSGLSDGQQVVLADLARPVPASSTTRVGLAGFAGAGRFGGGTGGGPVARAGAGG